MIKGTKYKHNRRTSSKGEDECNNITLIRKNTNNMTIWKNVKTMTTRGTLTMVTRMNIELRGWRRIQEHNRQEEHQEHNVMRNTRSWWLGGTPKPQWLGGTPNHGNQKEHQDHRN
jgi:hypothetical protein